MGNTPRICTVIPTFNNAKLIRILLEQLKRIPEFSQLSVVVVNNGSADETAEVIPSEFPFVQLVSLPQNSGGSGGFIAGINQAMTLNPEYIWMLDDDAQIQDNTLTQLLSAAEQLDREGRPWGAIGSMMANLNFPDRVTESGAWLDWKGCRFRPHNAKKLIAEVDPSVTQVEYCAAASLLSRPDVIRKVGFFENVFIHYDDVDWCLRLTEAGLPVCCAPASVFWHPSLKTAPVTWVRYYDARNFIWLCLRHNRKWAPWGILHMLRKGSYFYLHRMRGIGRLYFMGVRDALSGRLRMRSELKVEPFLNTTDAEPHFSSRPVAGVFYSRIQRDALQASNPELCQLLDPVFLYEPEHRTGSSSLGTKTCKLFICGRSFLYMLLHPRIPVVFDGECLHHVMLPPLFNKVCYVFTCHTKAILKERGER
jgi:GT2 family glycosyltransferase